MTISKSFKLAACAVATFAAALTLSAADAPQFVAARSIHCWHYAPGAEWVYGEVTPEKSVPGSYFMTVGFTCGYCGIQELSNGKKIAIFSVWDPGDQFDFKAKADSVDEKIRTKNTYAGEGVYISRFGGEGTGGKSTMWFDWEVGKTYRFAVHVKKDGDHRAAFTGYIWRDNAWFRMATFSTLQTKGNPEIRDVYSFVEDFRRTPESVQQVRTASYRNFFSKAAGGEWKPMNDGRFTGDSNTLLTVDAEVVENGLRMTTGGSTTNANIKLFSKFTSPVGVRPDACIALDKLPND